MRVPLSPVISTQKKSGLLMYDTSFSPPIPLPLRLGDADLDGFPDILLIATGEPHGGILGIGQKEDHTPKLLLSVPCAPGLPGCAAKGKGGNKRSFHVSSGSEVLDSITDASGVSFFDLDEDVREYLASSRQRNSSLIHILGYIGHFDPANRGSREWPSRIRRE